MSRFELKHPTLNTQYAVYGVDRALGQFVDFCASSLDKNPPTLLEYDNLNKGYDQDKPLYSILELFVKYGYFTGKDLADAKFTWTNDWEGYPSGEALLNERSWDDLRITAEAEGEEMASTPPPDYQSGSAKAFTVLRRLKGY